MPEDVYELKAWSVCPPFIDGAPVEVHDLGLFSTLDLAVAYVRDTLSKAAQALQPWDFEDETFVAVHVTRLALDVGPQCYRERIALSATGTIIGRWQGDGEEPWGGRDPETCKWKRGHIVSCVNGERYRVGVVLALPPSTGWVERQRGFNVTTGDDVYLVGFRGEDYDHGHPREWEMIEPLAPVPEELRAALETRLASYSGG